LNTLLYYTSDLPQHADGGQLMTNKNKSKPKVRDPQLLPHGTKYEGGLFRTPVGDSIYSPDLDGDFFKEPNPLTARNSSGINPWRNPEKQNANRIAATSKFGELTLNRQADEALYNKSFPPSRYADRGLEEAGLLPEYGFGSWLKDNGAGLLKGAGSLVSMIPGIGTIAGPILSTAGSVIGKVQGDNAAVTAEQAALDEQAAASAEEQRVADLGTRRTNIVDQKQVNYGGTFENGGQIGQGLMGQPQITSYDNGNTHEEGVGGIPVDARGNPSTTSKQSAVGMTEKGEITWNGYVFSDKLKNE